MNNCTRTVWAHVLSHTVALRARVQWPRSDDRGEGVISAAIAVLIMAFLGALMWVAFKAIWLDASEKTSRQVGGIGS
jgi:hypothetical protein